MKFYNFLPILLLFTILDNGGLKDCPKSPNCVCTTAAKASKRMKPIPLTQPLADAKTSIKNTMKQIKGTAVLVTEEANSLHFEVTTKTGKFIDDVNFLIDEQNKQIHFRSASRTGYYDLGANKRRMQRVVKAMKSINIAN